MNRTLFLSQLRIQLRGIPTESIEEIISDYENYFSEAEMSGVSEEQAIKNLGSPRELAKDLIEQYRAQPKNDDAFRNIIVVIGLIAFNLIVMLGLVIGAIGVLFGLVVTVIVFIVSPLLAMMSILFQDGHLFELFISFILLGVALLIYPLLIKLLKFSYGLLQSYVHWNVRMMRGTAS